MTPIQNNKLKDQAQARALAVFSARAAENADGEELAQAFRVEGYAARYDAYFLYDDVDGPVYERFEPGCFDAADMSDIIMQYDHAGRVYARTGNGTLTVTPDENGLHIVADLSRTEGSRQLYEDIQAGMITKMSWRFTCGEHYYDAKTRTIVHKTVKKVWDVSAVSIPANQDTEINARSFGGGVIAEAARSEAAIEEQRRKLRIKIKIARELSK